MGGSGWFVKETELSPIVLKLLSKFGEDQIVNGASIVFTISIIAILTI